MQTALWVRRHVLSVVSMLQRTYHLINQSCHPVCMENMIHTNHFMLGSTTFKQFRIQENKEDRGDSLVSGMVGLAQSEVYTHQVCTVALKGAAIDVECSLVQDGPSSIAGLSTWCCRSVCSSIAQGC
jgi:hypothetical protein